MLGHLFVTQEFAGEETAGLRHRFQVDGIFRDFRFRNFRDYFLIAVLLLHSENAPAPLGDVAHDVADIIAFHINIDLHDRFQNRGPKLGQRIFESKRASLNDISLESTDGSCRHRGWL